MEVIRVKGWQIEASPAETHRAQATRASGSPETCGCLHCRNFAAARHGAYPTEFIGLLASLGVPADRESEIWHGGETAEGFHFYGGWFHFIGRIVSGPDSLADGGAIELEELSTRFSMGFTLRLGLVPDSFPTEPIVQLEFSVEVPWVLTEPFTG